MSISIAPITPSVANCVRHAGDSVRIKDNGLTFRCAADGNSSNHTYPRSAVTTHTPSHVDYDPDSGFETCLYYVNDNNGMTVFDGKRKVRSKKNRAIIFDGATKHHSTTPTNFNWRASINIDYKI